MRRKFQFYQGRCLGSLLFVSCCFIDTTTYGKLSFVLSAQPYKQQIYCLGSLLDTRRGDELKGLWYKYWVGQCCRGGMGLQGSSTQ